MADPSGTDTLEAPDFDADAPEVLKSILNLKEGPTPRVKEGEAEPEPDEQDDLPPPEDGEEPDDTEEKAETEDEPEEKEELDIEDVDELLVAVTIDGKELEVPLKELKQSYSGNKFIEQNIQKAVEVRKAVEYNAAVLYNANQEAASKLQSLNAVLDTMTKPNIDWAALKARNPTEYVLKREELRELSDKQRLVQQEVERIDAEQAELQAQARQRLVIDQAQLLAQQLPELNDPQKAPVVMGDLVKTAERFGFTRDEVGGVLDHRQMLVLYAAKEWLRDQDAKAQTHRKANGDASARAEQTPTRKVLIRPGSSQNTSEGREKRLTAELYNRARKSGRVEDVAMTLLVPTRRRK